MEMEFRLLIEQYTKVLQQSDLLNDVGSQMKKDFRTGAHCTNIQFLQLQLQFHNYMVFCCTNTQFTIHNLQSQFTIYNHVLLHQLTIYNYNAYKFVRIVKTGLQFIHRVDPM